jgi:glycosyltransferase involved in cell wall biosynthesis
MTNELKKTGQTISVGVLSYNSEATVIETLDSILNQTYDLKKIELIISDDNSFDETPTIVQEWLDLHGTNFHRTFFQTSDKNTGISGNFNRILNQVTSSWLKPIAADDILMPRCLSDNVEFVSSHPESRIVFSNTIGFKNDVSSGVGEFVCDDEFFKLNADNQSKSLLKSCSVFAPTSFISTDLLRDIGGADERFPMIEDYPLWLKITSSGVRLYMNDVFSVYYRLGDSVSRGKKTIGNERYLKDSRRFHQEYIWPNVSLLERLDDRVMFFCKLSGIKIFRNRKSIFYKIFYNLMKLIRPLVIFRKVKLLLTLKPK